jgi:hypothetical protein
LLGVVGVADHSFKKGGCRIDKAFTKEAAREGKVGAGVADKMVVVRLPKGIVRNVAMDMGSVILMDVVTIN